VPVMLRCACRAHRRTPPCAALPGTGSVTQPTPTWRTTFRTGQPPTQQSNPRTQRAKRHNVPEKAAFGRPPRPQADLPLAHLPGGPGPAVRTSRSSLDGSGMPALRHAPDRSSVAAPCPPPGRLCETLGRSSASGKSKGPEGGRRKTSRIQRLIRADPARPRRQPRRATMRHNYQPHCCAKLSDIRVIISAYQTGSSARITRVSGVIRPRRLGDLRSAVQRRLSAGSSAA
jgi:hypothetical protein